MRRSLPALVALLAVVAVVATAAPAGSAAPDTAEEPGAASQVPVVTVPNTSGYLRIEPGETETARFATADVDVTGAIAADSSSLRDRHFETTALGAFDRAEDRAARTAALADAIRGVENRTDELQRRRSLAIRAYNGGELTGAQLLRRLALLDSRARELERTTDRVLSQATQTAGYTPPNGLRTRLANVQSSLLLLQGPVRRSTAVALTGSGEPATVYVETADAGVVLAGIDGGSYVREAYLGSEYRPNRMDQFARSDQPRISAAYERAIELYPWAIENALSTPSASGFGNTSVYRITATHSHGQLTSFIHGGTTNAFRELQRKDLDSIPATTRASSESGTLRLEVTGTHATGPLLVAVRSTDIDTPVDARVSVDGQPVGRTGSDGRLWTISPSGSPVINATTDRGETVTVGG